MESCEDAAMDNENFLPPGSSLDKPDFGPTEEAESTLLNTQIAFVLIYEGDDDILIEQTIESP